MCLGAETTALLKRPGKKQTWVAERFWVVTIRTFMIFHVKKNRVLKRFQYVLTCFDFYTLHNFKCFFSDGRLPHQWISVIWSSQDSQDHPGACALVGSPRLRPGSKTDVILWEWMQYVKHCERFYLFTLFIILWILININCVFYGIFRDYHDAMSHEDCS